MRNSFLRYAAGCTCVEVSPFSELAWVCIPTRCSQDTNSKCHPTWHSHDSQEKQPDYRNGERCGAALRFSHFILRRCILSLIVSNTAFGEKSSAKKRWKLLLPGGDGMGAGVSALMGSAKIEGCKSGTLTCQQWQAEAHSRHMSIY